MSEALEKAQDTSERRTLKQRLLGGFLSFCAFFTAYVLTAGPAAFLARRFDQPIIENLIRILYAPLIAIVKMRVPVVSALINWYVQLFR